MLTRLPLTAELAGQLWVLSILDEMMEENPLMSYASASHQHRTAVRDLARIQIRTPTIVQFVAS